MTVAVVAGVFIILFNNNNPHPPYMHRVQAIKNNSGLILMSADYINNNYCKSINDEFKSRSYVN